jgi:MoxR-like ATPase
VSRSYHLTRGQHTALGIRLDRAEELVDELRGMGLGGDTLERIAEIVARIRERTGAHHERPPMHRARGAATELAELAAEIQPRRLKAYGDLSDGAEKYLREETERLVELVYRLMDEVEFGQRPPRAAGAADGETS